MTTGFAMRAARLAALVCTLWILGCGRGDTPGQVQDEATQAGRDAASFRAADEDYFRRDGRRRCVLAGRGHVAATCGSCGPVGTTGSGTG